MEPKREQLNTLAATSSSVAPAYPEAPQAAFSAVPREVILGSTVAAKQPSSYAELIAYDFDSPRQRPRGGSPDQNVRALRKVLILALGEQSPYRTDELDSLR